MTARTYLIDEDSIKQRILLNPEFSQLLIMWHGLGCPDQWHSIETLGGQFSQPFDIDEYELSRIGVNYEPSVITSFCNQFYFSDLAKAFLVE
jgi:hypothetical protein